MKVRASFYQAHSKMIETAFVGANTMGSKAGVFLKILDTGATMILISTELMFRVSNNDLSILKNMKRQVND